MGPKRSALSLGERAFDRCNQAVVHSSTVLQRSVPAMKRASVTADHEGNDGTCLTDCSRAQAPRSSR